MRERKEEIIGSLVFLLAVLIGWGPFVFFGVRENFGDRFALLIGAGFGALAAGFIYDAAERLLGKGEGIYAAIVAVTFPAAGIVISQAPLLPDAALMFITSASLWFASRATDETRAENLFFVSLLSGVSTASFGFQPVAFLPLLAGIVVHTRAQLKPLDVLLALLPVLAGLIVNRMPSLPFAQSATRHVTIENSLVQEFLFALPWGVWLLAGIFGKRDSLSESWIRFTALSLFILTGLSLALGNSPIASLGSATPVLALITAALLKSWFDAGESGRLKSFNWIAAPAALGMISFLLWRVLKSEDLLVVGHNHALLAAVTGLVIFVPLLKDMRRWLFFMLALSGAVIGALWFLYSGEVIYEDLKATFNIAPCLTTLAMLALAGVRFLFGRSIPRAARTPGEKCRFDTLVARSFRNKRVWAGEPKTLALADGDKVHIAIFGDVTGSEFPFSSRRGGYFAFRKLVSELNERKPDVVICTGDLASNATALSYRRLRVLLRNLRLPLLVTPGNHDLVAKRVYKPHYFHGLFGTDNGSLVLADLRLVFLNTAWGALSDEQFAWLEETLASPHSGKTLVFCHKPLFDPREGKSYAIEHRPDAEKLHEIFRKHRVTAVFSGHIHSLLHSGRDGIHYIISGGGGSKLKTEGDAHHYLWLAGDSRELMLEACVPQTGERLLTLNLSNLS